MELNIILLHCGIYKWSIMQTHTQREAEAKVKVLAKKCEKRLAVSWYLLHHVINPLAHAWEDYSSLSVCLHSSNFISALYDELSWSVRFSWRSLAMQLVDFAQKASIRRNRWSSGHKLLIAGHYVLLPCSYSSAPLTHTQNVHIFHAFEHCEVKISVLA